MKRPVRPKAAKPAPSPLDRLARRSTAMLLAERALRLGAALLTLACAFLALSWSGLWLDLSPSARSVGVGVFGFLALFAIARELVRGLPSRNTAITRIDAADDSGLRPASALEDRLAGEAADPATATLWELHRRRLAQALARLPILPPRPDLPTRDPYALRAFALVAAVAAGFVAGPEKWKRLEAAFDWRGRGVGVDEARFDAWLDPPPYTGRAAMVLDERDFGETREAPIHSILHLRGGVGAKVDGAFAELPGAKPDEAERRFTLNGNAHVTARGGAIAISALPDLPPSIELVEPPRNNLRGSMSFPYKTDDDYGVVEAQAQFAPLPDAATPLYPPPQLPLSLPTEANGRGEAQATLDLSDHPWAGGAATMSLKARDEGGNESVSPSVKIELPQRHFHVPLARALAEQRRALVFDPKNLAKTRLALDALSVAPELFDTPSSVHLGLRLARRGIDGKPTDDQLREVCDLLWAMANDLDGANALQSERDLRAARERLREALARGAGEEEIDRLTSELREAMDKYLAEAQRKQGKSGDGQDQAGAREIDPQDIEQMMRDLKEAGKSGDAKRAQSLLDELTDILENLQMSGRSGKSGRGGKSGQSASELDKLSREQQQLRDDTYQGQGRQGARGTSPERQRDLRERLERQRDALRRSEEGAPSDLDDADEAMKQAEQAMEQGAQGSDRAVEAQGRALQSLRKGADELAKSGQGEAQGDEGEGAEGGKKGRDPLGRAQGHNGDQNTRNRYDPMGAPPAQRAHRVLEELRRRLGQPQRAQEELDYLQRLLKR
jgi:uncharacterized protein (TIGR02302 family)